MAKGQFKALPVTLKKRQGYAPMQESNHGKAQYSSWEKQEKSMCVHSSREALARFFITLMLL
jgi:hypothetical protein